MSNPVPGTPQSNKLDELGTYDPDNLLDTLLKKMRWESDAELCRALDTPAPVISKIRHRRAQVSAILLIRMHEVSGLSIRDLRALMGDFRSKFPYSDSRIRSQKDS